MSESTIITVLGPITHDQCGITDAHNHLWIDSVPGGDPNAPVLVGNEKILKELIQYRQAGGFGVVDCQPGGCGRNGNRLFELSRGSGVAVVAATGFHRRRYYPPDFWLWSASASEAADTFIEELETTLHECRLSSHAVRAGFIKIACEASLEDTPRAALEGAAIAAVKTGVLLQIHTEKGSSAEEIIPYFLDLGVKPHQIVLCHMDKRPDHELHRELARTGVLLEYDTFYRPRYDPEKNVWPLLEWMVSAGFDRSVALATDMAETSLWRNFSNAPGLPGFITTIGTRLQNIGIQAGTISQLLGENITRRLAGQQ
jgi:5-phospho-D-xylono-1,4-lactonase